MGSIGNFRRGPAHGGTYTEKCVKSRVLCNSASDCDFHCPWSAMIETLRFIRQRPIRSRIFFVLAGVFVVLQLPDFAIDLRGKE